MAPDAEPEIDKTALLRALISLERVVFRIESVPESDNNEVDCSECMDANAEVRV
jgi:hypothetical protein